MKTKGLQRGFVFVIKTALFFCAAGLTIAGCASAPQIYPPEQLPPYIRELIPMRLYAHIETKDTKIELAAGEYVTVMVKGQVRLWRGGALKDASSWIIAKYIGSGRHRLFYNVTGGTFESLTSGRFSLGIIDSDHKDNIGYFDIIIIVWKTKDYVKISGFLEELQKKDPGNRGIADALKQARDIREYDIAKAKASEEISATKQEIKKIEDSKQNLSGAAGLENQAQVQNLENRLAELTTKLRQLDETTLQLQQERKKSAQLSQELEEKGQREKELMSKIGEGAKVPPFVIVTSPEDGRKLEVDSVRIAGAVEDDDGLMQLEVLVNSRSLVSIIRPADATSGPLLSASMTIPSFQNSNTRSTMPKRSNAFWWKRTLFLPKT